jgi:drug/metabolite transporter (DMT)-like permease
VSAAEAHHAGSKGRALVALFFGALGIAFAPMFTRDVQDFGGIDPTVAAFWRVALAAPLLFVLMLMLHAHTRVRTRVTRVRTRPPTGLRPESRLTGRAWLLLSVPGVLFCGDLISWHWAFEYTSQANATLLANVAVILVALASWLWLKERFGRLFVFGGATALVGLTILLGVDFDISARTGKPVTFGDGLALLTAVFYGGYLLSVKVLRGRYTTLQVMAVSSATCALVTLPFALASPQQFFPTTAAGWLSALGLGWVAHCMGQGLIAYALARLPANFSVVGLLAQPVLVAVIEWLRYDQVVLPMQMVGGGIILLGILLARIGSREI